MAMKPKTLIVVAALATTLAATAALAHGSKESMKRHMQFMHGGVPAPYGGQASPLPASPATVAQGRKVYDENCALCHGPTGRGDGPGAKDLTVHPADLTPMMAMPPMKDEFFLWTIAEGGVPFGSPMPAFKEVLARDDIWRVIAFMRAGFPR